MRAPSKVDEKQLKDVHIKLDLDDQNLYYMQKSNIM